MTRRIGLCALLGFMFAIPIHGDDQPQAANAVVETDTNVDNPQPEDGPSVWMRLKLEGSQDLLAALVAADFDKMSRTATRMNSFGSIERFVRGRNEEYETQLRFFRNANQQIIRYADRKNVEGAALGFMQLTASCINCHKVIRDSAGKISLAKEAEQVGEINDN